MTNYNSRTIYRGNIVINTNGINKVLKENELLIYDERTDKFYPYLETFNLFLTRDLEKLTKRKREKLENQINNLSLIYSSIPINNVKYVDENSLNYMLNNENKEAKRK